jgi:CubicO group peptidase (beta-lactamase class C family)
MQGAEVTGTGIAIFNHGEIAYLKAYGLRDTEQGLPLTPDSVMTSASLSKSAFATMVMRLVQEHQLNLDKPVAEYLPKPLPEYPRYADLKGDDRYRRLTLRMLLSHTSGFPNWWFPRDLVATNALMVDYQPSNVDWMCSSATLVGHLTVPYSVQGLEQGAPVTFCVLRAPISQFWSRLRSFS